MFPTATATDDLVLIQNANSIYKYFDVILNNVKNPGIAKVVSTIKCIACNNAGEVSSS